MKSNHTITEHVNYCAAPSCIRHVLYAGQYCEQHVSHKQVQHVSTQVGYQTMQTITGNGSQNPVKDNVKTGIDATLAERGQRYGQFREHAVIAQNLQDVMRNTEGWNRLAPDQKQALSVIADKIARMLNGDPNYTDNWHDIIGYAKLVEDRLNEKGRIV